MTIPHTPEPWRTNGFAPERILANPNASISPYSLAQAAEGDQGCADAARAVACVNALAGVTEPAKALALVRYALSTAMKATYDGDLCDWEELAGALTALGATP